MRILHIMASRGLGGAETYATDMILSLHQAGVDQVVVMSAKAPRYAEMAAAGVRIETGVLRWPLRWLQRRRLKALIAATQPTLIHCWMRRAASLLPVDVEVDAAGKRRVVIGWFGGYYQPRHFGRCRFFVGVTRDIVAHMQAKGVPADSAFFVPTFPDIQPLPPVKRADLATPEEGPVFLALSRLHQKKGLDTLLKALKLVPQGTLWLAGEGPLRGELEALTASLGLQERVRFLGWRTDRAALLRAATVCVLPSRYEPFGTVILEAWAARTPFVACKSAGPAAHVTDGVDGLLVEIDDVEGLAAALQKLVDDPALAQRLVEGGYATFQQGYTRESVTAQMQDLYATLHARVACL